MKFKLEILVITCIACYLNHGFGQIQEIENDTSLTEFSKNIHLVSLSQNENWLLFYEAFDQFSDYHLFDIKNDRVINLGKTTFALFSPNSDKIGYLSDKNQLIIRDLKNAKIEKIDSVDSFKFSPTGRYISMIKVIGNQKELILKDLLSEETSRYRNYIRDSWNPSKDLIVITQKINHNSNVRFIENQEIVRNIDLDEKTIDNLIWDEKGINLLITGKLADTSTFIKLMNIDDEIKQKFEIDKNFLNQNFINLEISQNNIQISNDGKRVYFYGKNKSDEVLKDTYEIWDSKDKWIPPKSKILKQVHQYNLFEWDTSTNKLKLMTDSEFSITKFHPDVKNGLMYDLLKYEPQHKESEYADLYLFNLENNKKELVGKKIYTFSNYISMSPFGNYVAYFKDKNWWIYDYKTKKTQNITKDLPVDFFDNYDRPKSDKKPYGCPGWSEDEKYIIIYDQYDIWLTDTQNANSFKITNGRALKTQYRINTYKEILNYKSNKKMENFIGKSFDLNDLFVLDVFKSNLDRGIAIWDHQIRLKDLIESHKKYDDLILSNKHNLIFYKTQKYNQTPQINMFSLRDNENHLVYQSNPSITAKDLGNYELFQFKNINNELADGAILYPSNFDKNKKYPMIVFIYEQSTKYLDEFAAPTDLNSNGFNILNYIIEGYFVLLLDIHYKIGKPGESALVAVENAVKKSLKIESSIDKESIGIIGHSFGGYETAFIITKTNMFKAAVTGAPITDFRSLYHDIAWSWNREQYWRFENQQFRMGDSYYNLKREYEKNSPISNLSDLETPVLIWAGKEDYNINWSQSIYLYMGIKRLNKTAKLLLFSDEEHFLSNPQNKIFLSSEILKWFNKYLRK